MFRHSGLRGLTHNYSGIPAVWAYTSAEDSLSEILTDGYFDNPLVDFSEGDYVLVNGIDGADMFKVEDSEAISPVVGASGFVIVDSPSKFPYTQEGVHRLADNTTYFITKEVDLEGNRLLAGQNTGILGVNAESAVLKSTGLPQGTALITSEWSLPLRHIKLEAATILALDADGNSDQALDWSWVNFANTSDIGRIANYGNLICNTIGFLGVSGLTLDGSFGTIGFTDSIFSGDGTGTIITIPATATITRRFRVNTSAFVITGDGVGIDFSTSASVPNEGFILDTCNFAGGGTYTTGVPYTDNKARFEGNRGIGNSATIGGMYMQGNSTVTTISGTGTPVKVSGTTTVSVITQRFSHTANRLTYTGSLSREAKVQVVVSLASGNGNQIGIYIAKNGTTLDESEMYVTTGSGGRLENGVCQVLLELETDDYIEVFVENNSAANDITVEDLNLIIEAFN
ncbi:MAG: hypothetical protein ACN2B6_00900 [Rickettsiales bacterium]